MSVSTPSNVGTFITVGNALQGFDRLLTAVDAVKVHLPQPLFVQTGNSAFVIAGSDSFKFTDEVTFRALIETAELVITHGGVGSVLSAIKSGKKPIVVPRSAEHGEIANDHQYAFVRDLASKGLVSAVTTEEELAPALLDAVHGRSDLDEVARGAIAKDDQALAEVSAAVQKLSVGGRPTKIALVSAAGGHLSEIRNLHSLYSRHSFFHVLNSEIVLTEEMRNRTFVITVCNRDWRAIVNFFEAAKILVREKPTLIISTGAWPAIPFALVGRLLGIKNIYIETMAAFDRPTLTGRVMHHLASRFFYPWPQLKAFFPKGTYCNMLSLSLHAQSPKADGHASI